MNKSRSKNIIRNNSGETLVEVMVSFIVLMIVLAMFSGSIASCSSLIYRSVDIRRTSDNEYIDFHDYMIEEKLSNGNPQPSELSARVSHGDPVPYTFHAERNNSNSAEITLTAYKYQSGDTVYWVFK